MPSRYGRTPLLVWDEDDYTDLTPAAQHLDYVMRHDPTLTPCGRVDWRPARIAAKARGWTVAAIEEAAEELESRGFAAFDTATEEAIARRHIRWDEPLRNPKMAIALHKAYGAVASKKLRAAVVSEVRINRKMHPDFSSWTSPLSADLMTRLLGLASLDDLGIGNPISNHIGNPDRSVLVTEPDTDERVSITNTDDVITNHIGNQNRYGTPTPNSQLPTTIQGEPNGGTSPSAPGENETPPPKIESDSGQQSGNERPADRLPSRCCPRHPTFDPDCADCAATADEREALLRTVIASTEPPRRCPRHLAADVDVPCHDCQAKREKRDEWRRDREAAQVEANRIVAAAHSAAARQRGETRAAAMAACPLRCGDNRHPGYIDDGQGGTALCDHRPPSRGRPGLREQFEALKAEKAAATQEPAPDAPDPSTTEPAPETPAPTTDAEPEEHEDDRRTA